MSERMMMLDWLTVPHCLLIAALARAAVPEQATADGFDQTHARYAVLLTNFVRDARVDYTRLQAAPQELDAYLNELAAVKPEDFGAWTRENRLALLLNLYNARTLRLIADHYPIKSIRSIGVLPGAAWRQLVVRFGGQVMTLDHLENEIIRAEYRDPRV